ncbi:hypothetical protein DL766_002760 [Monosporascus sp. MC13-8B]|uniref:Mitochondrial outer membrane protein OM14 C-terminal domain-containing protein n=1 Tax=Monosporascus cannonballus TaxID=155416 RepID=A0ABY0HJZ2_9PEZI|nr:hypothetical protein DL763_010707 [Monosporascus cannonballus]RYO94859.1 hypothetical protein DL762_000293 [Monosporascus cannonballus]RYP34919.1 hypothetical protein DL766_002760 [Monosporascus sp. MC13-8B]
MTKDLRVKLGKSQVEPLQQGDPHVPWKPEVWNAAIEAFKAGKRRPEPRFPVVINRPGGDGPLDSPEKLQKLADLPCVPGVSKSRITELMGGYDGDEVEIADITWEQLLLLEERTEREEILVWFPDAKTKKPIPRRACVVKSVKEEFRGTETDSGGERQGKVKDGDIDEKAVTITHRECVRLPNLCSITSSPLLSYAEVAASGLKQSPEEAAAPQPPQVITEESASTSSLVDVDTPSVRTVPSDYNEQDVQTDTQAARQELEDAAARARAEADLAKKKSSRKARKADSVLTKWFSDLSDGATNALAVTNIAAVIGLGSYLGYKGFGLYERGRLDWKSVSIGLGIVGAVGMVEGVLGGYLYKGRKNQS